MSHETTLALSALLLFSLKHYLCDFVLQSQYQVQSKAIYGHGGGFIHAALHAGTSIVPLLVLTRSLPVIGTIVIIEFLLHYHVDWAKARVDERYGWTNQDKGYWIVLGLDQLIHQLTYLAITWIVIAYRL